MVITITVKSSPSTFTQQPFAELMIELSIG